MSSNLKLALLGTVQITRDHHPVTGFISKKAQALFAYLAITGRAHSRDELATLFWSDMPEGDARASLRSALFNLRQLFDSYLRIDRQHVAIDPQAGYWLDITEFRAALDAPGPIGGERRIAKLQHALDLYRGELMEGLYLQGAVVFDEWLLMEREQLRQQVIQGLYLLATQHMARGEHRAAIQFTTRILDMEPWREEAHRQLMLLLALSDQRSAALRHYETCRRVLAEELAVEPSEETTALYQRLCRDSWDVLPRPQPSEDPPAARAEQGFRPEALPFVGRGSAYAWLVDQFEAVRYHHGVFTLVSGEAGVGKTRLIAEVLRYLVGSGAVVLHGQCLGFEQHVPYQPLLDILRAACSVMPSLGAVLPEHIVVALAQLLPELPNLTARRVAGAATGEEPSRQLLFEAVAQVLLALHDRAPAVVVFLDDLQHADAMTIDVLRYLLHRLEARRIWWVGSYRSGELDAEHPLLRLCTDLTWTQRIGQLQLDRLDASAVAQLTTQLPGLTPIEAAQLAHSSMAWSDGNPLLLALLLQHLAQQAILRATPNLWQLDSAQLAALPDTVPLRVEAMIMAQLNRLPRQIRSVLHSAALMGECFDLDLLTLVSSQDLEDIAAAVDILIARELIYESHCTVTLGIPWTRGDRTRGALTLVAPPAQRLQYRFSSALVRRVVASQLSHTRRQYIHDRIAALARPPLEPQYIPTSIG